MEKIYKLFVFGKFENLSSILTNIKKRIWPRVSRAEWADNNGLRRFMHIVAISRQKEIWNREGPDYALLYAPLSSILLRIWVWI